METRRINKIIFYVSVLLLLPSFSFVYAGTLSKPTNNLGLVGYWSFNDATSTQATDFSGRGNTGTLINMDHPATATSGWGSGKFGTGLIFDGLGDYVTVNGVANDVVETSFTFSVWIKSGWTGAFDTVLAINTAGLGNQTQIFIDNTLTVRVYDGTQDATELSSSGSVVDGKWHHVVYTRNGATGTLYVDGVSQGTHNSSDTFTGTDLWSLGQEFDAGPTASDFFLGSMDEVRVYNRPLSGTEVLNLYNSGLIKVNSSQNNLLRDGLSAILSFDGADFFSNTIYDRSGNSNNGTIVGTTKVIGKIGQALSFDGIDDYVSINGVADDVVETSFAVSSWVKCSANGNYTVWGTNNSTASQNKTGLFIDTGGNLYVWDGSNEATEITGSVSMCNNAWHHTVYTRTGSTGTLYIDGVSQGTHTAGDTFATNDLWAIGVEWEPGLTLSFYLNGSIDDFRVYNKSLTVNDVKTLYNAGVGAKVSNQNVISGSTLQSGLVGMWSFNGSDTNSTTAFDRSSSGNDGTFVNGSSKASGKVGQGVRFAGSSSQYVSVVNGGGLNNLQTGSISFWVKWSGIQDEDSDPGARYGAVLGRQSNGAFTNQIIFLDSANPATAHIKFAAYTNNANITGSTVVGDGTWRHVVVTYQSGSLLIYVDGVQDGSDSSTGTIANDAAIPLTIGGWIGDGGSYSSSVMDEVRIYNRILTPSEVKQLYLIGR
jgi:hypothetical protein